MILTDTELFNAIKNNIYYRSKGIDYVEIVSQVEDKIFFNLAINGVWAEGYIKVKYDTDLEVYIKWPYKDSYRYEFDILWCDILPEGVE